MKTVLCYGDSITYGYIPGSGKRFPRQIRWPGRLSELLGDSYYVIEEGCNSRTTIYEDPLEEWRNGKKFLKTCLRSHMPLDIVILMLGTNDIKNIYHVPENRISVGVANLIDIIMQFHYEKQGTIPEILLIAPPEIGEEITNSEYGDSFDKKSVYHSRLFAHAYEEVAKEKGCHYLNAAEWVKPSPKDFLHLEAAEHVKLAEAVAEEILSWK